MSASNTPEHPKTGTGARLYRPIQVILVSSVMFTFISYWRTAAIVLGDLASTAYYIGGIVENSIGPAAPWFILAVMLFSYAVRSVYIESCSLFVRGGVYRVVRSAMGSFLAKVAVSALLFDYILTGPTSAVSAGQYIMGLLLETLTQINPALRVDVETADTIRRWGAVLIASAITIYFFRLNLQGIHESSGKALKIMIITTIVIVVLLAWCLVTLVVMGPANAVPLTPDLAPKVEYEDMPAQEADSAAPNPELRERLRELGFAEKDVWKVGPDGRPTPKLADGEPVPRINQATGRQEDPLGFVAWLFPAFAGELRRPGNWLSIIGVIGLLIAFAHSILAMSGEETLAQVYREVESPKLKNFKKAAFIVFLYSLGLTATVSFLAVLLIPNEVRMKYYSENLLGGLAMSVIGPPAARLALNAAVVLVGFLILSGAVNTALIGSNGVLNRVAEDGVMPDWFLKPHRRYGTSYRVLGLIAAMQLLVIVLSRGDMYVLGEAYAFGIVWSFAIMSLAMVVLRFKDRNPREYKVPFNVRIGKVEVPIGLGVVLFFLMSAAILNTLTKEVATIGGVTITTLFLIIFTASEWYHERRRGRAAHEHIEQFNQRTIDEIAPTALSLTKPYRKLVAIRSTQNLFMLEKALAETDPDTTDVIVMTAQVAPVGDNSQTGPDLDEYNRQLMTAVVDRAEKAGKQVQPLVVRTNSPFFAVVQTAKELQVQELVLGASNIHTADTQIEQIAFYWISLHDGDPKPLTVRVLSRSRDLSFDLAGGNRIPKIGERKARSIAELRSAGIGVRHVLLIHEGTPHSSDLLAAVLTMLDPEVALTVVPVLGRAPEPTENEWLRHDQERAKQLNREMEVCDLPAGDPVEAIARLTRDIGCDVVILGVDGPTEEHPAPLDPKALVKRCACRVCCVLRPEIPQETDV